MVKTQHTRSRAASVRTMAFPVMLLMLLALAACSDSPSEPVPTGAFSNTQYLWPAQPGTLRYTRSVGNSVSTHELQFSSGSITDVQLGSGGSIIRSTLLTRGNRGSGVALTGCDDATAFHLPATLRFQDHLTTVEGPEIRTSEWLTVDARTLLAADGPALFRYGINENSWVQEAVPWTSEILCLARDSASSPARHFAGTATDGVFMRRQGESNWQKLPAPPGAVKDIAIDAGGVIFAVIDASLYVSRAPHTLWSEFTIPQLASNVTSIGILPLNPYQSTLYIGTVIDGIAQVLLQDSYPAHFGMTGRLGSERIEDVRTSYASPYGAVGIANPPMLYVSPGLSGIWASVPMSGVSALTAVSQSDYSGTVLIGSNAGLFRFDGAPPVASGLQGSHIHALHYGADGVFYCGAESGSYRSADEGQVWTRIDRGNVVQRESGGFLLLPTRFAVGSSWDAGTLIEQGEGTKNLTGRVLTHFDEMLLPDDAGRYTDVMVVRYAAEHADGSAQGNGYSWTVYYAAGHGPVYIEEYENGTLAATTALTLP